MNEKKFLKNESKFLITETLIVQKLAYILVLLGEGEWFSYLFSVLRKISYKLGKKIGKFQTFSSSLFFAQKNQNEKSSTTRRFERSQQSPRRNYETMDSVFVPGSEI